MSWTVIRFSNIHVPVVLVVEVDGKKCVYLIWFWYYFSHGYLLSVDYDVLLSSQCVSTYMVLIKSLFDMMKTFLQGYLVTLSLINQTMAITLGVLNSSGGYNRMLSLLILGHCFQSKLVLTRNCYHQKCMKWVSCLGLLCNEQVSPTTAIGSVLRELRIKWKRGDGDLLKLKVEPSISGSLKIQ